MNKARKVGYWVSILFVIILISVVATTLVGYSVPKATVLTDVVSYPLPTLPEPVLLGGEIRVEVKAGSGASDWTAGISSRFGSSSLELINSSYMGDWWVVYFKAPEDLVPELYDLGLSFQEGGETVEYTHSRCVWLLEDWPEEIIISHSTDSHLQHGRAPFAKYIHQVNFLDPDLIFNTGDIVQTETVAAGWDYLQSQIGWLEVPSYLLPGNHDHAGADSKIYQKYCGPLNYSVVIGDFLFVALDSNLDGQDWADQFQWVESELQRHSEKVKILGWHHPFFGSEWETDNGTVKGGNITGDWEHIEDLKEFIYPLWLLEGDISDAASEMLRIIQEYDVRLILTGHIHRDIIYVLNDRHYFVMTGPVGGGLPPTMYHSSRLITLDTEGNVGLDWYSEDRFLEPPNSIPVDGLYYWYSSANDWSESAVTATIINDLEMPVYDGKLEFHVSGESAVGDYQFSVEPSSYEVYTMDIGHTFVAYFDVPSGSDLDVTLYAEGDTESPEIMLEVSDYWELEPLTGDITVTDGGWGVSEVTAYYMNDELATWNPIEFSFSPIINGDVYDITYPEAVYSFTVPAEDVLQGLTVRVEASDHAGNTATYHTGDMTEPTTYTLSVETEPAGVPVTIKGEIETAPYSAELVEGDYTVSVPEEVSLNEKNYTFTGWEDGITDRTRVVSLDGDTSLTARYDEVQAEEPVEEPEEPTEPEEEEEQKKQPFGGIPMPTEYAVVGLIVGAFAVYWVSRRK